MKGGRRHGSGRKAKPSGLKLVTGNPGKRRINRREPKAKRVIPSPPAHLSPEALVVWGSLTARLDRLGVLTELEDLALEQLCENYVEIVQLRNDVRTHGRYQTVTTKTGDKMERIRPAATLLADAERRFQSKMIEFGLTPSSRSRIEIPEDDGHSDPAEAYFA